MSREGRGPARHFRQRESEMSATLGPRELQEKYFRVLVDAVLLLQPGLDPEVTLEALIGASEMLVDHLQHELAEIRQEEAE